MAAGNIIKSDVAFQHILRFEPQKLSVNNSEQLEEFVKKMESNPEFQVADVVRSFTGLAELEGQRIESEIESRALEQLKEIQEGAYSEGFTLGMQEGQQKAFNEKSQEIERRLNELDQLIVNLRQMRLQYVANNESLLMKMVLFLATKVAMFEISDRPNEAIQAVISKCITMLNDDENMRIFVAPDQIEFLEKLKKERKKEFTALKNVEFQTEEGLKPGGCKIETNFIEIDARLEQRIDLFWEEVKGAIPQAKGQIENG